MASAFNATGGVNRKVTAMGSPKFDPLDLEYLDRAYKLACLYMEADNLCRTTGNDLTKEKEALRKRMFVLADSGPIKFDPLCERVLALIEIDNMAARPRSDAPRHKANTHCGLPDSAGPCR